MPWREVCVEELRELMVLEVLAKRRSKAEIAEAFGVSRKNLYKWLERYQARGFEGLGDRSRAPHHVARAIAARAAREIMRLREDQPLEGPLKIQARMRELHPQWRIPAASTIGDLLKRHNLVTARTPRKRCWPNPRDEPLTQAREPNDVWATDFKGWFRTRDGQRCDPLTVSDVATRYVLGCQRVAAQDCQSCEPVFEALFKEFGMPAVMRSDNGAPFASTGLGKLTRLSVKWVKAGIKLERIDAGHPEQNGCHERMHETLKQHTAKPPAASLAEQQQRFDIFRHYFNHERPHQALQQTQPARHYRSSSRPWPPRLEDPWYDADHQVRRVRSNGEIKWKGQTIFIAESLSGELLGIRQMQWGDWLISFAYLQLALIDYRGLHLKALGKGAYPLPQNPNP